MKTILPQSNLAQKLIPKQKMNIAPSIRYLFVAMILNNNSL